ncbi:MAG: sensor histidine kinase [Oligoflexia bacterium]
MLTGFLGYCLSIREFHSAVHQLALQQLTDFERMRELDRLGHLPLTQRPTLMREFAPRLKVVAAGDPFLAAALERHNQDQNQASGKALEKALAVSGLRAEKSVEKNVRQLVDRSSHWFTRFAITATAWSLVAWLIFSVIVRFMVRPAVRLAQTIAGLDLNRISADFGERLKNECFDQIIAPREVHEIWLRVAELIQRISVIRDEDFSTLERQKLRAEIIAASLSDGVFVISKNEWSYVNPSGRRILAAQPHVRSQIESVLLNGVEQQIELSLGEDAPQRVFVLTRLGRTQGGEGIVLARDLTFIRESQRAKNHFLGLLSHEIRTPVTSLVMAIRLLQRASDAFESPVHKRLIETSARDVERLRELLDDLLSISRFESGVPTLSLRSVDLRRLLRNAHDSFRSEAEARTVRIESQVVSDILPAKAGDGHEWFCEVDGSKLGWALSNLMLNAIRHSPKGGEVRVELRRSASADGRPFFEYRVQDQGSGISSERLSKMMEPYAGVYNLRVGRSEATGSGLSIARQIAEAHGGSLRVCSEFGRGSEFQLRFPMRTSTRERNTDGKVAHSG